MINIVKKYMNGEKETFEYNGKVYKIQCVHSGQGRAYGDSHYNYEVFCDSDTSCEEVLEMARSNPRMETSLQDYKDWGVDKDADVYFRGYTEVRILVNQKDGSPIGYAVLTTKPYTG